MPKLKSQNDIAKMRLAGQLAARILRHAEVFVRPGASTEDINVAVHDFTVANGAYPSPLNYKGFPKSVCTSVNEVICHGIPAADRILEAGDIINVDVTCTLDGWFGDCSATYFVGGREAVNAERQKVTDVSAESLARAIATVKHGSRIGDIGAAIQTFAEAEGCSVVRDFVGHGIGRVFHEEPAVHHFGRAGTGEKMMRGMTFTIEPMINAGDWRARMLRDGWTAVTVDGRASAQFEHTLAVSGDGVEILTALPDDPIALRAKALGAKIVWPLELG